MREIVSTRLRFVESRDKQMLISYVNNLPYKIEIKGAPIYEKSRWVLFFVLPDDSLLREVVSGKLD